MKHQGEQECEGQPPAFQAHLVARPPAAVGWSRRSRPLWLRRQCPRAAGTYRSQTCSAVGAWELSSARCRTAHRQVRQSIRYTDQARPDHPVRRSRPCQTTSESLANRILSIRIHMRCRRSESWGDASRASTERGSRCLEARPQSPGHVRVRVFLGRVRSAAHGRLPAHGRLLAECVSRCRLYPYRRYAALTRCAPMCCEGARPTRDVAGFYAK